MDYEEIIDKTRKYSELVVDLLSPKMIVLYGSYAKGTAREDSDIDIVADEFSGDKVKDILTLMKIRREIDNRIEPHPFRSDDFDVSNSFVKDIVSTGIRIM